jgi:DNA-binding Lrp family transcriptional regulator
VRADITDTFLLLQEGLSIEEIARARGVKNSAVWAELEKLLGDGLLEGDALDVLIPEGLRRRVEDALTAAPSGTGLRSIADALNNEVDYGLIRCVAMAHQMKSPLGNPE